MATRPRAELRSPAGGIEVLPMAYAIDRRGNRERGHQSAAPSSGLMASLRAAAMGRNWPVTAPAAFSTWQPDILARMAGFDPLQPFLLFALSSFRPSPKPCVGCVSSMFFVGTVDCCRKWFCANVPRCFHSLFGKSVGISKHQDV